MLRSRARLAATMAGVLAALVIAGAIVHRVIQPAEVVTTARKIYPTQDIAPTGVIGSLSAAPLIVDGRLRVFATIRQVRAEEPVYAETRSTPYWSLRRWPAQLTGVLVVREVVVTRWSDGELVALDATTGRVVWRAPGPRPRHGYAGRLTGASTLYAPAGLVTADVPDGRPVIVVSSPGEVRTYEAATGRQLWSSADPACRSTTFTTTPGLLATVDTCGGPPRAVEFRDAGTGASAGRWEPPEPVTDLVPLGCASGRSGCAGMRTTGGGQPRGWLLTERQPARSPALDRPTAWLVGEVAVTGAGDGVTGRSARTGKELWRRPAGGFIRVLAVQRDRVHLLTDSQELVTLDASSGAELSRFVLEYGEEGTEWSPGWAYARDGYVVVERLNRPVRPNATDREYYLTTEPVLFAGT
jgi:outer membrane protein assembly factor BamB